MVLVDKKVERREREQIYQVFNGEKYFRFPVKMEQGVSEFKSVILNCEKMNSLEVTQQSQIKQILKSNFKKNDDF